MKKFIPCRVVHSFILMLATLSAISMAETAAAENANALVVTWSDNNDKWSGSGPTQNTWTKHESEEKVLRLVANDKDRGNLRLLYQRGRFKIYSVQRQLVRGDTDPRRNKRLVEVMKEEIGIDLTQVP